MIRKYFAGIQISYKLGKRFWRLRTLSEHISENVPENIAMILVTPGGLFSENWILSVISRFLFLFLYA
jgi:hypothetical protein